LGVVDGVSQERFDSLRETEIKHGRISMIAVAGYITTAAGIRFPGYLSPSADLKFTDIPAGLAAFPAVPGFGVLQIVFFIAVGEMVMRDAFGLAEFPGDFRNGALDFGWDKLNDATKLKKRAIELNNGRAAMMGIWGLVTHELIGNPLLPLN
jgi:hypothetical protein